MSSVKEFITINSSKDFSKIYSKPTYCWHTEWFVLFYKKSNQKNVAFVASKKVGKAVFRNRAKRLLKSQFINFCDNLQSGQYILVAKSPILKSNHLELRKVFNKIYKRLKLYNY